MFSFHLPVLSLLCLLNVSSARTLLNSDKTLFGRVHITQPPAIPAPKTSELFSIGTASTTGGCSSQTATTDAWLKEVVLLHNAATTAYSNYKTDAGTRLLFAALMGVRFEDDDGDIYIDDFSDSLWGAIGGRLEAVSQFLGGGGLIDPVTSEPPWIFCSESFAAITPWSQIIKNDEGESVPKDGGGYVTLADAFPTYSTFANISPHYIADLKGYILLDVTLKCGPTSGTYAATTKRVIESGHAAVTIKALDRIMYFCPRGFDPLGQGRPSELHSKPLLSTFVTSAGYPDAGGLPLDQYVPLSATLYHELVHLTDSAETTGDPYYGLDVVTAAALARKSNISTNPESFVLFAMAAYLYQNPPEGSPAVLFLEAGLPQLASVAISKAAAGN